MGKKISEIQRLVFSLSILVILFNGCGGKPTAQEPDSSLISHQGSAASITPLDRARAVSAEGGINGDPELTSFHVKVKVFNDTATLSGSVDTEEQKEKAGNIAARTPGISKVENNLVVK